ncbi:NADH-quinone oxidoreductase subunit M, partial [Thermococci archaeon]
MNELALIVFAPLIAGALAWLIDIKGIREVLGVLGAAVPLGYAALLYQKTTEGLNFVLNLGVFKLTLALNMLNWFFLGIGALVGFAAILALVSTGRDSYEWLFALMSLSGVLGVFLANDLMTFFIFWEIMTFASFMMILHYNKAASLKYFLLSVFGAYAMLIALGMIYAKLGTFDFAQIQQTMYKEAYAAAFGADTVFSKGESSLIYLLFLIAFGVKAGMFPLHVWAPDAYSETNQSYAAMFSGVLSKAGVYGFIMLYLLMGTRLAIELGGFRSTTKFGYIITFLGGLTIIVGGLLAALQEDIRKLFAYSSISQLGYILVGIGVGTALSMQAALFHALSHALFKGLFFLIVATIVYRTGKTTFADMGGLAEKMPFTFAMAFVAILSLAG